MSIFDWLLELCSKPQGQWTLWDTAKFQGFVVFVCVLIGAVYAYVKVYMKEK